MKIFTPTLAVTLAFTSSALANENTFPAESARSYDGASFSVNIPDVECAVSRYLDIPLDHVQNDGEGLIQGQSPSHYIILKMTNPQLGGAWADVAWVHVSNGQESASINYSELDESSITATATETVNLPRAEYSVEGFEAFLKVHQCDGPSAALS